MTVKKLSVFAERMMPDFVSREHIQFTKFIRYYFEFLEQTDGVYDYASHSLEYMDIDYTKNHILEEFRNTYLLNFPEETDVDLRFLVKHIREFYKSKGSEDSYRFLFRLLYGDDEIDIYYPKLNILRSSDGKWVEDDSYDLGGYWKNTDGFLSSDMVLQDNYYYQDFSYEIITDVTRFYYENVVKQNIHVTGQKMFGRNILLNDVPMSVESLDYDKYANDVGTDLGLGLLWGGTPYTVEQKQYNQQSLLIDVNGLHVQETVEFPFVSIQGAYTAGDDITVRRLGHAIDSNITFTGNDSDQNFDMLVAYTSTQIMVFYDGQKMYESIDFNIVGTEIQFDTIVPVTGKKVYVLLHELDSVELISGQGDEKHIVLTNPPQGFLLDKIIVFFNNEIVQPEWYDPLTNRVYFTDYVADGTDNIEVVHLEALGIPETVVLNTPTKYNLSANKNEFLHLPESPYVVLIRSDDVLGVGIAGSLLSLNVYITRPDAPVLSLVERTAIKLFWAPQEINVLPADEDGGLGFEYSDNSPSADTIITTRGRIDIVADDIYFDGTNPYVINSITTDLSAFVSGDIISVSTEEDVNNGDYTVISSTATTITVTEVLLSASSGAVGNTTIHRDGLFVNIRSSDWVTVAGSSLNDGEYRVISANEDTIYIDIGYPLVNESNDTSGTIQADREIVQDRAYVQTLETSAITLLWDVTDPITIEKDSEGTTSVSVNVSPTDDASVLATEGTTSISSTQSHSDDMTLDGAIEGTTSILQTLTDTDISFTADSTISTAGGDFTVFADTDSITIVTTSGTNDGTYTISGAPTSSTITISETTLTTEDAATAGTVSISRTV